MSECLPTVTDIESVDCCMTDSWTLSNETKKVLLNANNLLWFARPNIKTTSGD